MSVCDFLGTVVESVPFGTLLWSVERVDLALYLTFVYNLW